MTHLEITHEKSVAILAHCQHCSGSFIEDTLQVHEPTALSLCEDCMVIYLSEDENVAAHNAEIEEIEKVYGKIEVLYRGFIVRECEYGGYEYFHKDYDGDPVRHTNAIKECTDGIDEHHAEQDAKLLTFKFINRIGETVEVRGIHFADALQENGFFRYDVSKILN